MPKYPYPLGLLHSTNTLSFLSPSGERIAQPTYVNMYELASMAASKAQELHFPPPPPPEDSTATDGTTFHNEKVTLTIPNR